MEEKTCPRCGRKFKVAIEGKIAIVIPQGPKIIDHCPECGNLGEKE